MGPITCLRAALVIKSVRCLIGGSAPRNVRCGLRQLLRSPPVLSSCGRPSPAVLVFRSPWPHLRLGLGRRSFNGRWQSNWQTPVMSPEVGILLQDVFAAALASGVALGLLRFWGEMAKRRVFELKMNRKLVHVSVGLVFMLFWPLFSAGHLAPFLAALAPGVNIVRMLLLGLGIWKNDAIVMSMSREGDYRELLKGPLYYACTLTLATSIFWRTSPIGIAAICNLCAGDGIADIVGRRYGKQKLPHNPNKSFAGSMAMAIAGFLASIGPTSTTRYLPAL